MPARIALAIVIAIECASCSRGFPEVEPEKFRERIQETLESLAVDPVYAAQRAGEASQGRAFESWLRAAQQARAVDERIDQHFEGAGGDARFEAWFTPRSSADGDFAPEALELYATAPERGAILDAVFEGGQCGDLALGLPGDQRFPHDFVPLAYVLNAELELLARQGDWGPYVRVLRARLALVGDLWGSQGTLMQSAGTLHVRAPILARGLLRAERSTWTKERAREIAALLRRTEESLSLDVRPLRFALWSSVQEGARAVGDEGAEREILRDLGGVAELGGEQIDRLAADLAARDPAVALENERRALEDARDRAGILSGKAQQLWLAWAPKAASWLDLRLRTRAELERLVIALEVAAGESDALLAEAPTPGRPHVEGDLVVVSGAAGNRPGIPTLRVPLCVDR